MNFSKSGASVSMGPRGASVTVGKKGTYLNTGIPGTGLYDRKRIDTPSINNTVTQEPVAQPQSSGTTHFQLVLDSEGKMSVNDEEGNEVTNQSLLRELKRSPQYKQELERMNKQRETDFNEELDIFIHIKDMACQVIKKEDYPQYLDHLKPQPYSKKIYSRLQPDCEAIRKAMEARALKEVNTMQFWKKKQMIEEFVETHTKDIYNHEMADWLNHKKIFEEAEGKNQKEFEEKQNKMLEDYKAHFEELLKNPKDLVEEEISKWVSTITFPFEFNLSYELEGATLLVDLDLPEIEDMPGYKAVKMANGTVKVKPKTQKELKEDYYQCVLGLALFFSSHLLELAPGLDVVIISAYTQRKDIKEQVQDVYIYSIKFDRERAADLDDSKSAGELAFSFENICDLKKDKDFKGIKPFEIEKE